MPNPCPSLHLSQSDNPYPNCVFLTLDTTSQTIEETIPLALTLRFNEQDESLLDGHLKFGVKGGKFSLTVEQGKIIEPQTAYQDAYQLINVSEESAIWQLIPQTGQSIIKGEISAKFAEIQIINHPTLVTLTYEVEPSEISITEIIGLWRHDIHPNKYSILERKLAQFLWQHCFSSYLSRLTFTSDSTVEEQKREKTITQIDATLLSQLHQVINRIYHAQTNNLLKLAQLAELDPLKDLAGGNFLANELSGIELSGANLTQSNFRGANLTDADLSEATLNYVRFSGADLSGAYLSNANLQQADLYRSSLVLANLIGANLTEANLQEVNLSQTNLSGAIVRGAKFGNNSGMTAEMSESLQARGAIFVSP